MAWLPSKLFVTSLLLVPCLPSRTELEESSNTKDGLQTPWVPQTHDLDGTPISRARYLKLSSKRKAAVRARVASSSGRVGNQKFGLTNLFKRKSKAISKESAQMEDTHEEKLDKFNLNADANATARARFYIADGGADCAKGWSPVIEVEICKLAQEMLGCHAKRIHDNTDWVHEWSGKPAGCFLHVATRNVNFNFGSHGHLNDDDLRFCENLTVMRRRIWEEWRREKKEERELQEEKQRDEAELSALRASVSPDSMPSSRNATKAPSRRRQRRANVALAKLAPAAPGQGEKAMDEALNLVNSGALSMEDLLLLG